MSFAAFPCDLKAIRVAGSYSQAARTPFAATFTSRHWPLTRRVPAVSPLAVLKSHSEFGREHLNAPWLLFFLLEQETHGELRSRYLISSMDGYWRYCIRDHAERNVSTTSSSRSWLIRAFDRTLNLHTRSNMEWVVDKIDAVREGEKWTEDDYLAALDRRAKTGTFAEAEAPAKEDA